MSTHRFHHVSVTCADFDRSMAFYHELLGLPILDQGVTEGKDLESVIGFANARLRFAELGFGEAGFLELFEYLEPRGTPTSSRTCDPGDVHFCLTVEDIEGTYARLAEADVTLRSPAPVRLTRGNWIGAGVFYAVDPDGVTIELIEFPERT
jgi:catechol 2,3-dioxygenase-like lactoylglutathione lyase family enzyme